MKLNNYVSFLLCCALSIGLFLPLNAQTTVLWGDQPGEGDFDGGLNDWTTTGTQTLPDGTVNPDFPWQWDDDNNFEGLTAFATGADVGSPTAGNGVVVLNADFYTTGGTVNPGSPPYPQYISDLVSPSIDLSGSTAPYVTFYQAFAGLNGDDFSPQITESGALIFVSTDGGATYVDTILVNDDLEPNEASPNGDFKAIPIFAAAGSDDVVLTFRFDGDFYIWAIDDVQVVEPAQNLVIDETYAFYPASSLQQPQVSIKGDTMGFFANIFNLGAEDAFDVYLKASIFKGNDLVWADSVLVPVLEVGESDTVELDNQFVPDLEQGTHFVQYDVYVDDGGDDFIPEDNRWRRIFRVTEDLFSKDDNDTDFFFNLNTVGNPDLFDQGHLAGNNYFVSSSVIDEYRVDKVYFQTSADDGETLDGRNVNVYFAELTTPFAEFDRAEGGSSASSGIFNSTSLEVLGFKEIDLTGTNNNALVSTTLENINGDADDPIILKPGTNYFVVTEYNEDNWDLLLRATDKFFDPFAINTVVYSFQEPEGLQWFLGGYSDDINVIVRFDIALENIVDVEETTLPETVFQISPNPASDFINAQLEFDQPTDVNVTIADMTGRVLKLDMREGITFENIQYDLSNYASGTYIIRLATKEGTKTYQFVVQK